MLDETFGEGEAIHYSDENLFRKGKFFPHAQTQWRGLQSVQVTREIIIVGAGVIGASCALTLARAGHAVRLLDVQAPGSACSRGNAGLIAVDHVVPLAQPATLASLPRMLLQPRSPLRLHLRATPKLVPWLWQFARACSPARVQAGTRALAALLAQADSAWDRLLRPAGLSHVLRRQGCYYVHERAPSPQAFANLGRLLARHDVPHQDFPAEQVPALASTLRARFHTVRHFTGMRSVGEPWRLVQGLAQAAAEAGARIEKTKVTHLAAAPGRIEAVVTANGARPCRAVVVCAGMGSRALLHTVGVHLPLAAERGYSVDLDCKAIPDLPAPITFVDRGFVLNPMDGFVRLAGTVELGARNHAPDWRRADILLRHAAELLGREAPVLQRWSGDRPTLPDYLPAVGAVADLPGLLVATGHQHLGLALAACTAERIRDHFDGAPAATHAWADVRRFDRRRLHHSFP